MMGTQTPAQERLAGGGGELPSKRRAPHVTLNPPCGTEPPHRGGEGESPTGAAGVQGDEAQETRQGEGYTRKLRVCVYPTSTAGSMGDWRGEHDGGGRQREEGAGRPQHRAGTQVLPGSTAASTWQPHMQMYSKCSDVS